MRKVYNIHEQDIRELYRRNEENMVKSLLLYKMLTDKI